MSSSDFYCCLELANEGVRKDGPKNGSEIGDNSEGVEEDGGVGLREADNLVYKKYQNC